MKNKRLWLLVGACLVLAGVWYWFRPERLFTNKRVDEAAPSTTLTQDGVPLYTGRFEGKLHKTSGRASVFLSSNGNGLLRITDFTTANDPALHVEERAAAAVRVDEGVGLHVVLVEDGRRGRPEVTGATLAAHPARGKPEVLV